MTTSTALRSLCLATLLVTVGTCAADEVRWSTDIETSLLKARQNGQLVLMKFTADWCGYCKKMERETFTVPQVAATVNQNFVPILVDADQHKALTKHLQVTGLPAILVVSPEMVILERIKGYKRAGDLLAVIEPVATRHYAQTNPTAVATTTPTTAPATRPVSDQRTAHRTDQQTVTAASERPATAPAPTASAGDSPAFGGLCLAGVRETRSLVSGRPQLSMKYRGRTLYFSSTEQQQNFQNNPDKYWPEQDGICPVSLVDDGRQLEGKLEFAAMYRGKLWVTSSEEAMQKFVAEPAQYARAVVQAAP